jgi:hypothetical protein
MRFKKPLSEIDISKKEDIIDKKESYLEEEIINSL